MPNCPKCNTPYKIGKIFCPACGYKFSYDNKKQYVKSYRRPFAPSSKLNKDKKEDKNRLLFIAIASCVLVLMFIAVISKILSPIYFIESTNPTYPANFTPPDSLVEALSYTELELNVNGIGKWKMIDVRIMIDFTEQINKKRFIKTMQEAWLKYWIEEKGSTNKIRIFCYEANMCIAQMNRYDNIVYTDNWHWEE